MDGDVLYKIASGCFLQPKIDRRAVLFQEKVHYEELQFIDWNAKSLLPRLGSIPNKLHG